MYRSRVGSILNVLSVIYIPRFVVKLYTYPLFDRVISYIRVFGTRLLYLNRASVSMQKRNNVTEGK